MRKRLLYICALLLLVCQSTGSSAQDKNYIKGLQGTDSLSISRVWAATMVVPGYGQAYNRQYWKIPVIYAGIGSMAYMGYHYGSKKNDAWNDYQQALSLNMPANVVADFKSDYDSYKLQSRAAYAGAALFYIGGALDAVWQYKTDKPIVPAKPTVYSVLVPGLGQIYNKEYWKVPIIYGGLAFCGYLVNTNNIQYNRFRNAYNAITADPKQPDEFNGRYSASDLQYYRDGYRRNRDYSILATGVVYVLNIIDAHVFAYLADYDVSDNLSMRFEPTLFPMGTTSFASAVSPTVGFNLTITLK